jgi:AcrR family transcriptional regulator
MSTRFTPIDPAAHASTERADAARNRAKVLDAAKRLFAERGVEHVSMDEIADAAGVGKGTLYRRFHDRAGLAMAVLDTHDRAFQHELLRGKPPLGPGAPPRERLMAFTDAMIAFVDELGELLCVVGSNRYRSSVYAAYHLHVAILLRQARPECDAPVIADLVLGSLAPDLHRHLKVDRGLPTEQIAAALHDVVSSIIAPRSGGEVVPPTKRAPRTQ